MGILNITPDSFHTRFGEKNIDEIISIAGNMIAQGAAILDTGGQSTRPGSTVVTADEELERVIPVLEAISKQIPGAIISIDTYYSSVAKACILSGAHIVNDISAGEMDASMMETVGSLKVPYICMHMKGTPQTMQHSPTYTDVVKEVLDYFIAKTEKCRLAGIHDVILDPGFGFGKTTQHNFQLLNNLDVFGLVNRPILAGLSRKGMIYKTLGTNASGALNGTSILNTIALQKGASILRVHDVKEAIECIQLVEALNDA